VGNDGEKFQNFSIFGRNQFHGLEDVKIRSDLTGARPHNLSENGLTNGVKAGNILGELGPVAGLGLSVNLPQRKKKS